MLDCWNASEGCVRSTKKHALLDFFGYYFIVFWYGGDLVKKATSHITNIHHMPHGLDKKERKP